MAGLVPAEDLPTSAPQQPPMPQDMPQAASPEVPHEDMPQMEVPDADMPEDQAVKPVNNAKAFVEGMGRSMTFGGTDAMQHGIRNIAEANHSEDPSFWADTDKDVSERKDSIAGKIGEGVGIVAGLLTGSGAPGIIAKGAKALTPAATSMLGKLGAASLAGALESGMLQTSDEVSNSLLGKGDPEAPVSSALAHIGGAALLGGFTGGIFNAAGQTGNKALVALENAKMGTQAQDVLTGMGMAARAKAAGVDVAELKPYLADYNKYKTGIELYENGARQAVGKATKGAADTIAAIGGFKAAGPIGAWAAGKATDKLIAPAIEKIMDKPLIGATNKLVIPTIMYALSKGQTTGLFNAINHASAVAKGAKAIGKGVDAIFKAGNEQAFATLASDKDKQKIKDYIDGGGIDKEMSDSMQEAPPEPQDSAPEQGFAEGGEVKQDTWRHPNDNELKQEFKEDGDDFFNNKYGGHNGKFSAEDYVNLVKKHGKVVKLSREQIEKTDPISAKMVDTGGEGSPESSGRIKEALASNTRLPHPIVVNYGTDEKPMYSQVSGRHRIGHAHEHGKDIHVIAIPHEAAAASHDGGSISSLYPDQDMMLSAAKGRVSNYLSSLKPVQSPEKLPFDKAPEMKDTEKEYHAAVDIAASPLGILNHVKDGTLQASQVKDFTSMYPELHQYLSKQLTQKMMKHQLEEETIPYKTRLALSLFMGTALDSTMKPLSIMAAQQAFMVKPTPPQQPGPNKKSKGAGGKLGKDNKSYKTASQAAESDRSDRD